MTNPTSNEKPNTNMALACIVCDGWLDSDEAVTLDGGPAHPICAEASPDVRRWLMWSKDIREEDDPSLRAPIQGLVDWVRAGGVLGETATLTLLNELDDVWVIIRVLRADRKKAP